MSPKHRQPLSRIGLFVAAIVALAALFSFIKDLSEWNEKNGLWRTGLELSACIVAAALFAIIKGEKSRGRTVLATVLTLGLVVNIVGVFMVPVRAKIATPEPSLAQPSPVAAPPDAPNERGIVLNGACENAGPATQQPLQLIEICVVYWCKGSLHTPDGGWVVGQGQIKLRPLILNKTDDVLDLSIAPIAAVRLLVSTARPPSEWWLPPALTANQGDHPIATNWNGQVVWSIPPNMERDAIQLTLPDGSSTWDGFATLGWDYGLLPPRQIAFKELRTHADGTPIQEGDLVFNVPNDADSLLLGIEVVDRNDPTKRLAASDAETWPEESDLNSF